MSRSEYSDGDEDGTLNLYRANVDRALRGKRGQKFLRELADALDAMPVKELVAGNFRREDGRVCALGALAKARGLDVLRLDCMANERIAGELGVKVMLVRETEYENDEAMGYRSRDETPAMRWTRMRAWVDGYVSTQRMRDADR